MFKTLKKTKAQKLEELYKLLSHYSRRVGTTGRATGLMLVILELTETPEEEICDVDEFVKELMEEHCSRRLVLCNID